MQFLDNTDKAEIELENKYDATWNSLDARPIPSWFEDARFGIFIHWGLYSVPAWRKPAPGRFASYAEWYYSSVMYDKENGGRKFHADNYGEDFEYRDFAPQFRAELFNPQEWAELFRKSGAKYAVLTTKHHDGYCLWPTKSRYKKDWNSMVIGPRRDLVGELSRAVRNEGLRMGLYYSIIEWESCKTHRTDSGYFVPEEIVKKYGIPENEYIEHMNFQLRELVKEYSPSLIFSDGGEWDGMADYWKTKEFLAWLYSSSSVRDEVVVNDRFSKDMPGKHGDYYSTEYRDVERDLDQRPWEESRGIGESYGYNRAENLSHYSTSGELILELVDTVSRGGNLLLNIGPSADGCIPVIMQERLLDIGSWLSVNGEAIYGTSKRLTPVENGNRFTVKDRFLYCFFEQWGKPLKINLLENENPEDVSLVGYSGQLLWTVSTLGELTISLPELTVDMIPCMYLWTIRIQLKTK